MNQRTKSGHDYSSGYLCKRPNCPRRASYGRVGFCQRHYESYLREMVANGQLFGRGRVDARPVSEHIADLLDAGMQIHSIAHFSGVSASTIWRVAKQHTVNADTAARIMGVSIGLAS